MPTTTSSSNSRPTALRQLSLAPPSGQRQLNSSPLSAPLETSSRPATQLGHKKLSSVSYSPRPTSARFSHPVGNGDLSSLNNLSSPNGDSKKAARRISLDPSLVTLASSIPRAPKDGQAATVLTLTEKHADLLRFIAQKEAKCLELRTQLLQHEADLLSLKSKWERIVSRANPAPSPASPILHHGPSSLGGIREGVGKILAMGAAASGYNSPVLQGTHSHTNPLDSHPPRSRMLTHPSSRSSSSSSAATYTTTTTSTRFSISSTSSVEVDEPPEYESDSTPKQSRASSVEYQSRKVLCNEQPSPIQLELSMSGVELAKVSDRGSPLSNLSPISLSTPITSLLGNLPAFESLPSSLGKKWEEIQRGEGFAKQTKRASLLLSDMSNSLLNALAPPPPNLGKIKKANPPIPETSVKSSLGSLSVHNSGSTTSLLDDDLIGDGEALGKAILPVVTSSPSMAPVRETRSLDDDDWNW